jgi:hypothetical protein
MSRRSDEDTLSLARAIAENQRRMYDAEREQAAADLAERGCAFLWTPSRGVVRVTSLGDWDTAAAGGRLAH